MFGFLKRAPIMGLSPSDAHDLSQRGEIRLVDVRETAEWQQQRLPGALHAPLSALEEALAGLPMDRPIVFYCLSGKRSATAIGLCRELGLPHERHMEGGLVRWRAAGLPVES